MGGGHEGPDVWAGGWGTPLACAVPSLCAPEGEEAGEARASKREGGRCGCAGRQPWHGGGRGPRVPSQAMVLWAWCLAQHWPAVLVKTLPGLGISLPFRYWGGIVWHCIVTGIKVRVSASGSKRQANGQWRRLHNEAAATLVAHAQAGGRWLAGSKT